MEADNPMMSYQPRRHFLATVSSSWGEKRHLGCCRNRLSSEKGLCLSSSVLPSHVKSSVKLTENVDVMKLRQSSKLVLTALNDVNRQDQEQHQEELKEVSNQIVAQPFNNGITNHLSHEPELPTTDDGEHKKQESLAKSSCKIAEKRLRLALEACTNGRGATWAAAAFSVRNDDTHPPRETWDSSCTNRSAPGPDEHPKSQMLENTGSDTEYFHHTYIVDSESDFTFYQFTP